MNEFGTELDGGLSFRVNLRKNTPADAITCFKNNYLELVTRLLRSGGQASGTRTNDQDIRGVLAEIFFFAFLSHAHSPDAARTVLQNS